MTYKSDKKYWLKSHAGKRTGKYLNVYGNETFDQFRNVCLWSKEAGANSEGWYIIRRQEGEKIVSALNISYGLDFYRGSANYGNCDIHTESGNDTDSVVIFEEINSTASIYRIKLKKHTNAYLTAMGTNNASDVRWDALNGIVSQQWKLEEWQQDKEKIIPEINSIYNQAYKYNDAWIIKYGCAACCACNINSFYSGEIYTIAHAKIDGVYDTIRGVNWGRIPYANCTPSFYSSQSAYISKIKEQIDLNRPVLVHCVRGTYEHWVVAYGYTGEGCTASDILVSDPYNNDTDAKYGVKRTLHQAMDKNYDTFTINRLMVSSARH